MPLLNIMLFYALHEPCLCEQNNKAEMGVETLKWTIETLFVDGLHCRT